MTSDRNVRLGYRGLGRSGLRVSEVCLGAMTFGQAASAEESRAIFTTFLEAGGNFVDTANNYGGGESERLVGELAAGIRDRLVIATKYTAPTDRDDPNSGGNHRKSLVRALDASLARLDTDYIDLYWVHAWDGRTPVEEVMRALDDAVRAGKILHVGISNTPSWIASRANTLAELRGWSPFVAIQIEHSLIERTGERELLPMARALGLSVLAWGPLGGGLLSGKYLPGRGRSGDARRLEPGDRRLTPRNLEIAGAVAEMADELGVSPAQVAHAWLRSGAGGRPTPIVGARTQAQLEDSLAGLGLVLDSEQLRRLDEVSRVSLGYPHDFLRAIAKRYGRLPTQEPHGEPSAGAAPTRG